MSPAIELDAVDREILRLLQLDARTQNKDLAERVGLAPSTCLARVRRLSRAGVITGFTAVVDPDAVGRAVEALLSVQMRHARSLVDPFVEAVRDLPETRAVFHVTGRADFVVHVACGTVGDLQRLVLDEFTARAEVGHVETHLVYSRWDGGPLPPFPAETGD
ncbi:DNA-binding Lrp family transcriptional regulator [Nocardioides cavernae]|uniref:DNA-binding Lrp family transcriptional regulator n=1 Tax=Nocardioides cavernae TaxID=1921566 RepID=A0A7Y9H154_9ACTN|nr:Lrp/AsnC family transcriptional regulator [Nocardioides cavernae]NYE36067.1 DNA-binding Lrp family transcriptional regulator [Nocardioides cavernae]